MKKEYYIISLKHTAKTDRYLTLWRPDNAGYCLSKEMAGIYTELKYGYHDSEGQLPIEKEVLEKLMINITIDGFDRHAVPNCVAVWDVLRVKFIRNDLIKI